MSVNSRGQLGPATSTITLDGGTLLATGSSAINTDGRNYVFGPNGATFNITNTNNTGLSMRQNGGVGGEVTGPSALIKNGAGTLRFDRGNSTFWGGIVLNAGTLRFNNNNDAGPKDFRMNRVTFNSNTALLNIGGSGSSTDAQCIGSAHRRMDQRRGHRADHRRHHRRRRVRSQRAQSLHPRPGRRNL